MQTSLSKPVTVLKMKPIIKLVAIAKNEALYIPGWVHHHFKIGVDFIEIYINNTKDNSIEVCDRIKKKYKKFDYFESDDLFKKSINQGQSFQLNAYNQSLEKARESWNSITHLLVLDIDEYLMPRDFNYKIKDLIESSSSVDIFSFLWYSDDFDKSSKAIKHSLTKNFNIYRMNHVKSMTRIHDSVKECIHHNFVYSENHDRINQFSSCQDILLSDEHNTHERQSVLNTELLDKLDKNKPEQWFILHQVYKSETEYISSLFRSDECNGDFSPLKSNRWGMQPFPCYESKPIKFKIAPEKIEDYRNSYLNFIAECDLKNQIKKSRKFVINRSTELDQILEAQPILLKTYSRCFKGTKYESYVYITEENISNRQKALQLNTKEYFKFHSEIINFYNAANPEGEENFVKALNGFYGYRKDYLSDFTSAEFGYWHTQHYKDEYKERGEGGDHWMR